MNLRRLVKIASLALAVIMSLLVIYTLVIGVRLWYYSWSVIDSEMYMGDEVAYETYVEASEGRKQLQEESWYANAIYNANNFERFLILVIEMASVFTNVILYGLIKSYEKPIAKKRK